MLTILIVYILFLQGRETALSLASYFEAQDIVAILLKAGAKTDLQEKVVIWLGQA